MAEPDAAPTCAPLRVHEGDAAARLLARAFRDNPLNCAVIESDDPGRRERINRAGMLALVPSALRHACVLAARDAHGLAGVLIAIPPGAFPLPPPPLTRRIRCVLGQGWRVAARWGEVFRFLEERHPCERHWYLATLGVEPALQRRGIGRRLVSEWLARVDRDASSAYLETDRPGSVAFYRAAGFETAEATSVLGAAIWRMYRPSVAAISTTRHSQ